MVIGSMMSVSLRIEAVMSELSASCPVTWTLPARPYGKAVLCTSFRTSFSSEVVTFLKTKVASITLPSGLTNPLMVER